MSVFAREEVVPRLMRARAERQRVGGKDPGDSLERVHEARLQAAAGGELEELEDALRHHRLHHADASLGEQQERLLEESERWLGAERRRRAWLADLQHQAPGAQASVKLDGGALEAELAYPAGALRPLAAEPGWRLTDDRLEFTDTGVTLERLPDLRLDVASGLPATADDLVCVVDLVFPPPMRGVPRSGPGLWFFEFQGVLLAMALRGDDMVVAAVAETSVLGSPELLKRALHRALTESAVPVAPDGSPRKDGPVVVPGAVHRLQLESIRMSDRSRILFRALLDGQEIAQWSRPEHESQAHAALKLYPMLPVGVERVVFRGRGL